MVYMEYSARVTRLASCVNANISEDVAGRGEEEKRGRRLPHAKTGDDRVNKQGMSDTRWRL